MIAGVVGKLAGWRGYALAGFAGAIALSMCGAAVAWYGHTQRQAGREECQEAHRVAGLEEFKSEAERLTGLSQGLAETAQKLAEAKPKIIERYTREIVQTPLPADCVRDPGRVRATNDAIDAANAAGQLGDSLPASAAR